MTQKRATHTKAHKTTETIVHYPSFHSSSSNLLFLVVNKAIGAQEMLTATQQAGQASNECLGFISASTLP